MKRKIEWSPWDDLSPQSRKELLDEIFNTEWGNDKTYPDLIFGLIKPYMERQGWEFRLFSYLKPTYRHQAAFWTPPGQYCIADAPKAVDAVWIAALRALGHEVTQ